MAKDKTRKTAFAGHSTYNELVSAGWDSKLYDNMVRSRVRTLKKVWLTNHALEQMNESKYSNRNFTMRDIIQGVLSDSLHVVEFEARFEQGRHKIHKVVVRFERENSTPVFCAIVFNYSKTVVLTAWENTKESFQAYGIARSVPAPGSLILSRLPSDIIEEHLDSKGA